VRLLIGAAEPRCRQSCTHSASPATSGVVRVESSLAVQHWWGVRMETVWRWRQALGVERYNEDSARVCKEVSAKRAAGLRGKNLPPDQVDWRQRNGVHQHTSIFSYVC
jgi:hypothetical protein